MISQAKAGLRETRLLGSRCSETTMAEMQIGAKGKPSKLRMMTDLSLADLWLRGGLAQLPDLTQESKRYLYPTPLTCSAIMKCPKQQCAKTKYVEILYLRLACMVTECTGTACMETSYTEMAYMVKGCTETVCRAKACMEKAYKEIGCTEMACKGMACMVTECMVLENRTERPRPTSSALSWPSTQEVKEPKYDPSLSLLTNSRGDTRWIIPLTVSTPCPLCQCLSLQAGSKVSLVLYQLRANGSIALKSSASQLE